MYRNFTTLDIYEFTEERYQGFVDYRRSVHARSRADCDPRTVNPIHAESRRCRLGKVKLYSKFLGHTCHTQNSTNFNR